MGKSGKGSQSNMYPVPPGFPAGSYFGPSAGYKGSSSLWDHAGMYSKGDIHNPSLSEILLEVRGVNQNVE